MRELKKVLDIDPENTGEDAKLNFFVEQASGWIETIIGRPGLTNKSRTEYRAGTNTQRLPLRFRPVFSTPTIAVNIDEGGFYGSASGSFDSTTAMTYGTDFCLDIDQDDGISSRSGILLRINALWDRATSRQTGFLSPFVTPGYGSIKVVYTGGYTVDTLPPVFRLAANTLVARLRVLFPLGIIPTGESYEERNISVQLEDIAKDVKNMLWPFRQWSF